MTESLLMILGLFLYFLITFIFSIKDDLRIRKLMMSNYSIETVFQEVSIRYVVSHSGGKKPCYFIVSAIRVPSLKRDKVLKFKSKLLSYDPTPFLQKNMPIIVYLDKKKPTNYYMDTKFIDKTYQNNRKK